MTTRRIFMQVAAAAVPASLAVFRISGASAIDAPTARDLHAVVIDEDHATARAFGRRLDAGGARVLSLRGGDVTALWMNEIRSAWAARPAPMTGLTTPAALFCFEQLGFAHGLRVIFHAEHVMLSNGGVEHQLLRTGPLTDLDASYLTRAGHRWPTRLADALSGRAKPRGRKPGPSLAALQPVLPEGATLLTSWIIA